MYAFSRSDAAPSAGMCCVQSRRPRRRMVPTGAVGCAVAVALLSTAAAARAKPFVYVANEGISSVSQYDALGGPLVSLAADAPTGAAPDGVAASPDGRSLYIANLVDATVSQYDIAANGALAPKAPPTVPAGSFPSAIVANPDGKSVYVTNQGDRTVSQYAVGANGALTLPTAPTAGTGLFPTSIAA